MNVSLIYAHLTWLLKPSLIPKCRGTTLLWFYFCSPLVCSHLSAFLPEQIKQHAVTGRILWPFSPWGGKHLCHSHGNAPQRCCHWPRALSCVCLSTLAVQNFLHLYSRHRQADRWQPAWHGHVTQRTRRTQRTANQKRTWEIIFFPSKMVQIKSNSMQVIQWHKSVFTVAWSWSCKYPALNVVHKIHKDVTLPT